MWLKQCHKPPYFVNDFNPTYKHGDDLGIVYGIILPTLPPFMGKSLKGLGFCMR